MSQDVKKDEKNSEKTTKIENENLAAALCYFLVGVIWYFADEKMKKSNLVKFHVKQALNLLIISAVINTVLGISIIGLVLMPLFGLFFFIVGIIGFIGAINSEKKAVPIIGGFAEKYLKF